MFQQKGTILEVLSMKRENECIGCSGCLVPPLPKKGACVSQTRQKIRSRAFACVLRLARTERRRFDIECKDTFKGWKIKFAEWNGSPNERAPRSFGGNYVAMLGRHTALESNGNVNF